MPGGRNIDVHAHCPTCGRGPFWVVAQRVPPGAAFRTRPAAGRVSAAGTIQPTDSTPKAPMVNNDDRAWNAGDRIEWDGQQWTRINP